MDEGTQTFGPPILRAWPRAAAPPTENRTRGDRSQVEVLMGEGRNRQVRRMFDYVGYPVLRLVRTAIGPLSDSGLQPGQSRLLTSREVAELLAGAKAEQ